MNYLPYIENIQKFNDLSSFDVIVKSFERFIFDYMSSKKIINVSDCYDKVTREILRKTLEFDINNVKNDKN